MLDSVLKRADGSSLIYRPSASEMTSKGCANLPLGVSRDDVRARGAQVVLVGNCRSGWASDVYGWDDNHVESGSTPDYKPFPTCDKTYPRSVYDAKFVRYFEDSTFVSAATDPGQSPEQQQANALTPARVGDMTRCGVNLFGLDQLLPNDGRIEASIWSWAKGQPKAGERLRRAAQGRPLAHASVQRAAPRRMPHSQRRLDPDCAGLAVLTRPGGLPRGRRQLRRAAVGLRQLAAARSLGQPRRLAPLQAALTRTNSWPAHVVVSHVGHGRRGADPAVRRVRRARRRRGRARGRLAAAQGQEPGEAAGAGARSPHPPRARDRAAVARPDPRGSGQQLPPGAVRRPAGARGGGRRRRVGRSRSATTCSRSTRAATVEIDVDAFEAAARPRPRDRRARRTTAPRSSSTAASCCPRTASSRGQPAGGRR